MRIPRILFKTPKHKRFEITPRYYDPVREEIEQRTATIRAELEQERKQGHHVSHGSIRGSFTQSRERRQQEDIKANVLLGGLLASLVGFVFAFLEFGNYAFALLLLIVPLYIYIKSKS